MNTENRAKKLVKVPNSSREMLANLREEGLPFQSMDMWVDKFGVEYALLAAMGLVEFKTKRLVRDSTEIQKAVTDGGSSGERAIVYIALTFYFGNERQIGGFHGFYQAFKLLDGDLRDCVITVLKRMK